MANRRFEMYQLRHVIHRMRLGQSDRAIARSRFIGRLKCTQLRAVAERCGWLKPDTPLPDDQVLAEAFDRAKAPNPTHQSLSALHKARIQEWVHAGIQMTTIHQRLVENFQFNGSYSSVRRLVQTFNPPHPKATCILTFAPGEAAQVDFGQGPEIIDAFTGQANKTWIFVMTLCFSRHMYAEVVTDQKVATWLGCHRRALEWFGGVPAKLIIDNAKCAITRACYRDPEVQRSYGELAEGYGFLIAPCPPAEPQMKGRVEAGVKYVKKNFVPLRRFRGLADANDQLRHWVLETAGNRIHGTTQRQPLGLFAEAEKPMLRPLPDVPVQPAVWTRVKLHGDCHVRFEKVRYSAPFRLVGQSLWLKATDNTVKLYRDLKLVAVHPRLTRPGERSSMDDHMPPEALAYKMRDPQWCLRQAEAVGPECQRLIGRLFADRVLDNLRAAQGIVGLVRQYGPVRLEAACQRALCFDDPKYRTVKSILHQGLDQTPLTPVTKVIPLAAVYTGSGRFLRSGDDLQGWAERRRP